MMMMTSTTLTTAPSAKSVQKVPKKVRMRVPIASSFFFLRGGARALGLFGFQSRAFQKGPILNSDRSNLCVYNRYRFRLMGISLSLLRDWGRETLQQLLKSRRRFGVDRPKNASCCCFRARARERERERATVLIIQPFRVARDKEGQNEGGRGPSWMMM